MDTALVENLIDQAAANSVRKLFLSGFGEPLLDNRLPLFIARAKKLGIANISIVTNGYLLTPEIASEIINQGLNEIIIPENGQKGKLEAGQ